MTPLRDVAIVGAGLLGLAAGRALAARGRDVVVLEQAAIGHDGSGSKGSCRIFRLGYPDPGYVAAARAAGELWRALEAESSRNILRPAPQLTFGTGLRGVHDAMLAAGASCELLSAAEVASRFPALRTGGPALLEPDSAVIAADQALAALAAAGPEIRTAVAVSSLADDGTQVTLRTSAGLVTARTAIITAGPLSSGLLAGLGVPLPGRPTMEQVAYLATAGGAPPAAPAPIFICHAAHAPYGLPAPESALYKIGIHRSGPALDPAAQDQSVDQRLADQLAQVAVRHLPGYDPVPVRFERCVYDNTPDEDFVVDRIGNVVVGCGTSGHGFKFGPLFGQWLADLAIGPEGGPEGGPGGPGAVAAGLRDRFALGRFR